MEGSQDGISVHESPVCRAAVRLPGGHGHSQDRTRVTCPKASTPPLAFPAPLSPRGGRLPGWAVALVPGCGYQQGQPRCLFPAGRGRSPFFRDVHVSLQSHPALRGGCTGQHRALWPAACPRHPAEKQAGSPGEADSLNTPFGDR